MVEINAAKFSLREVNTQIRQAADRGEDIVLLDPDARHNLAVGLTKPVHVTLRGSAGYFCAGLCDGPTVDIQGNVGWAFGDNLMGGTLRVEGNAGAVCGVAMRAGEILVRGNMSSRAGQVMKGGSIVCCGHAGFRIGSMMMGGVIIVLGDADEALGEFIMDGEVYVAGKIKSLGEDAVQADIQTGDVDKINAILARHGLSHPGGGTFKKIISDQRALRYAEYEKGELMFEEAQEEKSVAVAADGNRDVMSFDSD